MSIHRESLPTTTIAFPLHSSNAFIGYFNVYVIVSGFLPLPNQTFLVTIVPTITIALLLRGKLCIRAM